MTDNLLELIKSADVEWKTLGEVVKIKNGRDWKHLAEGSIPIYGSGGIMGYVDTPSYEKVSVLIPRKGTITNIFYTEQPFWNVDTIFYTEIDETQIVPKFLYYFMTAYNLSALSTKSTRPSLTQTILNEIQIPIPSLPEQEKIVKVLDKMTKYVAELTLRHKQYTYYRDKLLSEDELAKVGFEWKTLGKVVELKRGKRLVKSELQEKGKYPVYQNSMKPLGYYNENNFCADTVFIISAGAAGEIGYSNCDFWAADDVFVLLLPDTLNSRFLYHFLLMRQYSILSKVRRASVPRLSRNVVESIQIPIPPLPEQERIVAILDKFDTLINSISEGIPKEIELRQKQYEYWREQLLSFDK